MERKLASIRRIAEIKPIQEADKICAYRVDDWWVVDSVDKYKVNDLVVYLEPDSWVPTTIAPFLSKGNEPKVFDGVQGERLKTVKLRKQISQGLLLNISVLPALFYEHFSFDSKICYAEGVDVTSILGILKYESPAEKSLPGNAKGKFPIFIPKTDQERIQNIGKALHRRVEDQLTVGIIEYFEVTEKLDGQSITVFVNNGEAGVCSRNLELKDDGSSTYWNTAHKLQLIEKLKKYQQEFGKNLAIQGEQVGPGIQGNPYKLGRIKMFVYDIYDIDAQRYLLPGTRNMICNELELDQVPLHVYITLRQDFSVANVLAEADGKSYLNPAVRREGFVYKSDLDSEFSFKTISNEWLLKEK